jgi:predicted O-methyltransferase YrrM
MKYVFFPCKTLLHYTRFIPSHSNPYDGVPIMTNYSLDHLIQGDKQDVIGPIQDDEALFLFSIIKGMKIKTVFEIGGLNGYSATNFLKAVGNDGAVFTCDINPVQKLAENHFFIHKNALDVVPSDLNNQAIELIFFDCHEYEAQMMAFCRLRDLGLIDSHTVLALHDTNTHPYKTVPWAYPVSQGYVHQAVERKMVNDFVRMGYHAFCLHTRPSKHSQSFPYRHGITVMSLFAPLEV